MTPPVKVGQKITEYIFKEAKGKKDAVIKLMGYVIFVPTDKKINESIKIEIIKVFEKYAFAKEIIDKEVDECLK